MELYEMTSWTQTLNRTYMGFVFLTNNKVHGVYEYYILMYRQTAVVLI